MNYEKETENLTNYSGSFKPDSGTYQITIIEEPKETEYIDEKGNKTPQIELIIDVNQERRNWYISKSKTFNGLFGQLMLIGKQKGKLTGEQITLLVKRSKDKNDYTIQEAINLIPKQTTEEQVR